MGISNLLPFLKPIIKSSHISKYKNEIIGVDIMCWIHRGLISCAFDIITENFNNSYLNFIEKMLDIINYYEIKVVFVFDGEELPEKKKENIIRKNRRDKAKKEAQEIIKKVKNPRSNEMVIKKCIQALSVTKEIIDNVIDFCKRKNIKYIISPYEADAQLSYLCRMGYISCVISEDSDLLVYGCPRVLYKLKNNGDCNEISLFPINDLIDLNIINKIKNPFSNSFNEFYITPIKELEKSNKRKNCEKINDKEKNYDNIIKDYIENFCWPEELNKLKYFNIDMFLAMCILSGCDYTNDFHINGMGIKTAFNLVYQYKNIKNIFLHLISNERWKYKIPENLNTIEKLMNKYHEIKNAFLQHEVHDLVLNENISINKSFKSSLKNPNNLIIINRILKESFKNNNLTEENNSLINNTNTNLTPKKNYEENSENEKEKEKEQYEHFSYFPNTSGNIFQNFTSECLEYLEISPELLSNHKNIEKYNNSEKEINNEETEINKNVSHKKKKFEETQHKANKCSDKFIENSNHYNLNDFNNISENKNIISKLDFFEKNELNKEIIFSNKYENIDKKSSETTHGCNIEEIICSESNKRKLKNIDPYIYKKAKLCIPQMYTNNESQEDILEKKMNYNKTLVNDNQNMIYEQDKINYNSNGYNCEVKFNHNINKCNNKNDDDDDDKYNIVNYTKNDNIINDRKKVIKTESAKNIYENMKKNFFLFKQINENVEKPIESSKEKTFSKCESSVEKDENIEISLIQEYSDIKKNEEEDKEIFRNEINKNIMENGSELENKNKIKKENELDKQNELESKNKIKKENELDKQNEFENETIIDINLNKKKEITKSSLVNKIESSFSPLKGKTPIKSEKCKSQLRITNFFKKVDKKNCKQSILKNKNENYNINKNCSISFNNSVKSTEGYINSYFPPINELNNIQEIKKKKKCESNTIQVKDIKDYFIMPIKNEGDDNKSFLNNLNPENNLIKRNKIPLHQDYIINNKEDKTNTNLIKNDKMCNTPTNVSLEKNIINKSICKKYSDFKENKLFKVNDDENKIINEQKEKNIGNHKITKKYSNEFSDKNKNESKEKTNEINLEYILQNLNYNYQPKNQKINTFDYFKEKENVPYYNPYIDNNL
ncbi:exonuclease I, putative [Plasmodium gallinaceum]|uniref:Exonuclease 1 n=1 Tax=Plasmodium gallinaceum TaxID=5849 RepID=A0A1J1GPJ1_PLAGA|nr:exonuclease I, putative [Plasmodium gallinaceum]CRG94425.1 exonuclease I, putative [Plasmodium gallinaceum]